MAQEINRKHGYLSKVYKMTKVHDGIEILTPVFYDLSNEELYKSFKHFIAIDDFEYAEEIRAEMLNRGMFQ